MLNTISHYHHHCGLFLTVDAFTVSCPLYRPWLLNYDAFWVSHVSTVKSRWVGDVWLIVAHQLKFDCNKNLEMSPISRPLTHKNSSTLDALCEHYYMHINRQESALADRRPMLAYLLEFGANTKFPMSPTPFDAYGWYFLEDHQIGFDYLRWCGAHLVKVMMVVGGFLVFLVGNLVALNSIGTKPPNLI